MITQSDHEFIHVPYDGSDISQIAIGIKLKSNFDIFKPHGVNEIPQVTDDIKSQFVTKRIEFLTALNEDEDTTEDERSYITELVNRDPELYFYFGTS